MGDTTQQSAPPKEVVWKVPEPLSPPARNEVLYRFGLGFSRISHIASFGLAAVTTAYVVISEVWSQVQTEANNAITAAQHYLFAEVHLPSNPQSFLVYTLFGLVIVITAAGKVAEVASQDDEEDEAPADLPKS